MSTPVPMSRLRSIALFALLVGAAQLIGCALDEDVPEDTEVEVSEILNGTQVDPKVFPEIALVEITRSNGVQAKCTGFAIARNTVVTARHCLEPYRSSTVFFPFNGFRTSVASRLLLDTDLHDVAALLLSSQVDLPVYATIPSTQVLPTQPLRAIGRVKNGAVSDTGTFHSGILTATRLPEFNYNLRTARSVEHGDSGGPLIIDNSHTVVGVSSGFLPDDFWARTELVAGFLALVVHNNSSCRNSDTTPGTCTGNCAYYTCTSQCWPRGTPTAFVCGNHRLADGSHVPRHDAERNLCRGGSWDMVLGPHLQTQCFTNTTAARCPLGVDVRRGAIPLGETHHYSYACGTDSRNYICRPSASGGGWVSIGGSCGSPACRCTGGVDLAGRPVDPSITTCGSMVCGTDAQLYRCAATGLTNPTGRWTATGVGCR